MRRLDLIIWSLSHRIIFQYLGNGKGGRIGGVSPEISWIVTWVMLIMWLNRIQCQSVVLFLQFTLRSDANITWIFIPLSARCKCWSKDDVWGFHKKWNYPPDKFMSRQNSQRNLFLISCMNFENISKYENLSQRNRKS